MTEEEIEVLKKTASRQNLSGDQFAIWIKAFKLYNHHHEKKFNMGCAPCYFKVLKWHIEQNKQVA